MAWVAPRLSPSLPLVLLRRVELNLPPSLPSIVQDYFLYLNGGQLEQIAPLFREDGILHSPLDGQIQGREAIMAYFRAHSQGIICYPETVIDSNEPLVILGKVHYVAFLVKVEWTFCLNQNQIQYLRVRLLASLQELLKVKQASAQKDTLNIKG